MWQKKNLLAGNQLFYLLGGALLILIVLTAAITYGWSQGLPVASLAGEPVVVTVKAGMSTQDIGEMLYSKGLIRNVFYFRLVAKNAGLENSLKAGDYALTPNMAPNDMLSLIAQGKTAYVKFTIPEGFTIDQIAKLLGEKKLADPNKFRTLAKNFAPYDYMSATPNLVYRAEGFLFPDTYRVPRGITEEQLLRMMANQFDTQLTPAMRQKAQEKGLSIRELVILASLVEKEARIEKDRPIIAGVFINRIKQDMPLQSCATIQYILGYPKPELTIQDTEIPSPYNTYRNMGLPPGPIANPGIASINAVLSDNTTDYLYFVADSQGAHHFSRTYDEHLTAINRVN
ncbi:MAG TPA: endolytic transglycosylase MltG [Patescibacteria group bacterium]|nr:endolytic transglycosylase MltG [Patescibacteria group bacterium]